MTDLRPDCPFCAIIAGDAPADVVYRDEEVIAFLDRRPLFPGHLLVSPTRHIDVLASMSARDLASVMRVIQAAATAMEAALGAEGSFIAENNRVSQSVPHVHFHVVPRRRKDGLKGFFWPRRGYEYQGQCEEVAEALRAGILDALS